MTYIELINEFWKQDRFKPFGAIDTRLYFLLVNECNVRSWLNPFEFPTYELESRLQLKRKAIGDARQRLKERGMIDFTCKQNNPTLFTIMNVELNNELFLQRNNRETIGKQLGNNRETIGKHNIEDYKTKEYTDDNNNILLTRTREEQSLEKFDMLLQEIYDGKYQIWENQMMKKFGIESVSQYLPSFRNHVISNARLDDVVTVKELQRYFVNAFRFFSKSSPIELLNEFLENAESDDFKIYCKWIVKNAINVAQNIYPLSENEFLELKKAIGSNAIMAIIQNLNNRVDLTKKYFSLYRTIINWHKYESTK